MKQKLILLLVVFMCVGVRAQVISGPIAITGNSLVNFAPWQDSGITPTPVIRGWNGNTCVMLGVILHADVAVGTKTAVLVEATNDVHDGVTPQGHFACIVAQINWLLGNRPGIKVVVANTPPFAQDNCYGDYRAVIAAYNALYAQLPSQYPPSQVKLVDIWTGAVDDDGWGNPALLSGPCGIHFGQSQTPSPGWTFFMGQISAAVMP